MARSRARRGISSGLSAAAGLLVHTFSSATFVGDSPVSIAELSTSAFGSVSEGGPSEERVPPQDVHAEQSVLGGMLLITRPDQGSTWPAKFVSRAGFIGCVGLQDEEAGHRLTEAFAKDWDRVRSLRLDASSPDDSCWFAGDGWWLSTAEG